MKTSVISPIARRKPRRRLPLAGLIGCAVFAFWLLMAVAGPYLAPDDAGGVGDDVFAPLSMLHPLGTDYLGRDMLSRILHGAPYTIGLALAAVLVASVGGLGRAAPEATTREQREASSRRWGNILFVPALLVPAVTLLGTSTFKYFTVHGVPLVDPKQVTVISLGLATLVALAAGMVMLRAPASAPEPSPARRPAW